MTWTHHVTVSDRIHRLTDDVGGACWGIEGSAGDDEHSAVIGRADVRLPGGPARLLLVEPFPGGLVLDVVRSYGGLTEAEIGTLAIGIADELVSGEGRAAAADRLALTCFGLDASGRPRCIPGMRAEALRGTRAAVGEMLYHAAAGRPWTASLEPVDLAFGEFSAAFRGLVGDLVSATDSGSSVVAVLDEVVEELRAGVAPAALPLLPVERDLDPEASLTARLRATPVQRDGDSPDIGGTSAPPAAQGIESRLRAISRAPVPSLAPRSGRHRRSRPRRARRAGWARRPGWAGLRERLERLRLSSAVLASVLVAVGVGLAVLTWSPSEDSADATSGGPSTAAGTSAGEKPSSPGERIDGAAASRLLEQLSDRRVQALQGADRAALAALTVPGSAAAAADEVLDLDEYAGHELAIDLADVTVVSASRSAIVVRATMASGAGEGSASAEGSPSTDRRRVEFDLRRVGADWKVAEVREVAGS